MRMNVIRCALMALALFGVSAGCSRQDRPILQQPADQPLVWPAPPDTPRIQYLGTVSTEKDLKKSLSMLEGLETLIFGKGDLGVLMAPSDMMLSHPGRLHIADSAGGVVHLFDYSANQYKQFGAMGQGKALQRPVGLVVIDDYVYVTDSQAHCVCVFQWDGQFVMSFGESLLVRPSGIAYHAERQEVVVADTGDHNLKVFRTSGQYVRTLGTRGVSPGQFNFPTHVCTDQDGRLLVSDTLNYRIQILSASGQSWTTFGEHGDRPGYFGHPSGVATDQYGHIYVADRQFENIQVFDRTGRILLTFGQEGRALGEFWLPSGVFVDDQNWIYVADTFNKRIQVFKFLEASNDR
jgi:DNA-binding beta-propeller fold protein YncE